VFMYLAIFIFLVDDMHLTQITAQGSAAIHVSGNAYSQDYGAIKVWDLSDIIPSTYDSGIVVLPSRVRVTTGQTQGTCPSLLVPCVTSLDCFGSEYPNFNVNAVCSVIGTGLKGCMLQQWCPAENIYNSTVTQIYDLDGVDQQELDIRSTITFPFLSNRVVYTPNANQSIAFPDPNANKYTVEDILILAGTTYEDVRYIGTVIKFDILWTCDFDIFSCESSYQVTNLEKDQSIGYSQTFANFYTVNGVPTRDEYHYSAIKIYFNVIGLGVKTQFINIVMEIFVFIALLFACQYATDFLMLNFYREKKHYADLKFADPGNLNEHSDEIKKPKEKEEDDT